MKGILDLLARAKLVELSEDEKQAAAEARLVAAAPPVIAPSSAPAERSAWNAPEETMTDEPAAPTVPTSSSDKLTSLDEAPSWETIYATAGIPGVSFPAEKLLRLLDGLRAMDGATRKAAVLAMDAADDNWRIEDCVEDARRKIAALADYKLQLATQLQLGEQQAAARLADEKAELDTATQAIRQQIAELEQLLERKISQSAQNSTAIEAQLRATREAIAREARRIDAEIDRLNEIPLQFSAA